MKPTPGERQPISRDASVSVIVATYNAADTLERCVDSVLGQDQPDVELLIADGGSTDGTLDSIERYADRLAWWVSEPDSGLYNAWNKAIPHATGEWICFLGADDVLAGTDVIRQIWPFLVDALGRYRVVYGQLEVIEEDGSISRRLGRPWSQAGPRFTSEMSIPHPGCFHHRSLFQEHGLFDESYRIAADYEFLLRELPEHDALFVADVTTVRMGAGGLSDDPAWMARLVRETHRARYQHGLVAAPDWRSFEVLRATMHARLTQWFGRRTADRVGDAYRAVTRTSRKSP
jgi:glycosyltransferase involved in cell wall biosynthesis